MKSFITELEKLFREHPIVMAVFFVLLGLLLVAPATGIKAALCIAGILSFIGAITLAALQVNWSDW